jgi:hypothetical protein
VGGGIPVGVFNSEGVGKFTVGGSIHGGGVTSGSDIGTVNIGGDLQSGALAASGQIKTTKVFGSVSAEDPTHPAVIAAMARTDSSKPKDAIAIDSLLVRKDVENAQILLGYQQQTSGKVVTYNPKNADASAGKVVINGDWTASSLVAGIFDATADGFGRNDTVIPHDSTTEISSRIASVVIKGTATGSTAAGDSYAITAQEIGKVMIGGRKIALSKDEKDDVLIDGENGDFRVVEV